MTGSERFGREYYRRFYRDGRTSVASHAEMARRAEFIAAYVRHIDCPVSSVLDAGCGLGLMREPLMRALPGAAWVGLEYSAYLCQRYGWTEGSLAEWRPTGRDWRENADQTRTDRDVTLRSADWYRSRLKRNFRQVGAGLWLRKGSPLVTWELETAG
ncbi:MAG: class I SAM-dependent methyltransferase [Xanthomonadales bacterium]|nr:class I SAM-dependent methyltransferase [Xanthomonadales bacterium]